ncbi:hypothetical protein [Sphingomonas sediminicola]|uniref:hypothetical protein n=1 Tax=Sphingomonas sediminicola TaxID=386874 RepID=UPI00196597A9|nr:hypothetical protein ['Sphingomonas ginsengisoli' Hoang et al. 2012]
MNQAFAPPLTRSAAAVRWSGWVLAAVVWASGAVFGLYILLFFGGNALHGALERWNGRCRRSTDLNCRPPLPVSAPISPLAGCY